MKSRWNWRYSVVAAVCVTAGWLVSSFGPVKYVRVPVIHRVTTIDTVYHNKPVLRTSFVDRVVYRTVSPDTVLVTLPGTVDTVVQSFCAGTAAGDSTPIQPRLVLTAGSVGERGLRLFGFTNTGRAYQGHWVARPPYDFVTSADSSVVTQKRLQWHLPGMPQIGACVFTGAAGYLLGRR